MASTHFPFENTAVFSSQLDEMVTSLLAVLQAAYPGETFRVYNFKKVIKTFSSFTWLKSDKTALIAYGSKTDAACVHHVSVVGKPPVAEHCNDTPYGQVLIPPIHTWDPENSEEEDLLWEWTTTTGVAIGAGVTKTMYMILIAADTADWPVPEEDAVDGAVVGGLILNV